MSAAQFKESHNEVLILTVEICTGRVLLIT